MFRLKEKRFNLPQLLRAQSLQNALVRGFAALVALATQWLLIRALGLDEYGRYAYFLTAISLVSIISKAGGDATLSRLAAISGPESFERIRRFAIRTSLLLSSVCGAVYALCSPTFKVPQIPTLLFVAGVAVLTVIAAFTAIGRGNGQVLLVDLTDGLLRPLMLLIVAGALVYLQDSPSSTWPWGGAIAYVVAGASIAIVLNHQVRLRPHREPCFVGDRELRASYFSAPLIISGLFSYCLFQLDTYLLASWTETTDVGGYHLASNYVRLVIFFPMILVAQAQRELAQSWDLQNRRRLCERVARLRLKCLVSSLPLALLLWVAGAPLMRLSAREYETAGLPLAILATGHVANAIAHAYISALAMGARNKAVFMATGLGAAVAVPLYFLLIPRYQSVGAAIAASLGMLVMACTAWWLFEKETGAE